MTDLERRPLSTAAPLKAIQHGMREGICMELSARRNDAGKDLFPNHIDGHTDGFGRHAGIVVASLIAELCLYQMVAALGHQMGLYRKLPGVNAEFGVRIEREGKVFARRIACLCQPHTRGCRHLQFGGNQIVVFGHVRVDVEVGRDLEVQGNRAHLACRKRDLLREEKLHLCAACDGAGVGVDQR